MLRERGRSSAHGTSGWPPSVLARDVLSTITARAHPPAMPKHAAAAAPPLPPSLNPPSMLMRRHQAAGVGGAHGLPRGRRGHVRDHVHNKIGLRPTDSASRAP